MEGQGNLGTLDRLRVSVLMFNSQTELEPQYHYRKIHLNLFHCNMVSISNSTRITFDDLTLYVFV